LGDHFAESSIWGGDAVRTGRKSFKCSKEIRVEKDVNFAASEEHDQKQASGISDVELTEQTLRGEQGAVREPLVDALM
jgi:hypothetical protein